MSAQDTSKDDLAPVPPADGLQYLRFMEKMHAHLTPEWYLEIGTAQGASLKLASCNAIAIDPRFQIKPDNMGGRPQTHLFETTSDDFFATGIAQKLAPSIDMAFLDGMHLFEYLLRDFINAEKLCRPDSVIVLHDLVPPSYIAAARDWDRKRTKLWTGDVWKVGVILKEYRPDLTLRVANCRPTGLGIVTSLDPHNTTLEQHYDEIVARFMDLELDDYGTEKLGALFQMQRAMSPEFHDIVGVPA